MDYWCRPLPPPKPRSTSRLVSEAPEALQALVVRMSTFPSTLDPRLWLGVQLKPDVRANAMALAAHLLAGLRLGAKAWLESVELFGSNASFEYDQDSDFGMHVFLGTTMDPQLLEAFLKMYNNYLELHLAHHVKFYGVVVEVVFHAVRRPSHQPQPGIGQYSISDQAWIVLPVKQPDTFNRADMLRDARRFIDQYNAAVAAGGRCGEFAALKKDMKAYRAQGFDQGLGSRSTQNLTYRLLRRLGVNVPAALEELGNECELAQFSAP